MPATVICLAQFGFSFRFQGRRRLLKSGPAMKGQRRSRVPKARVGGEHEKGAFPSRKGGSGENFIFPDVRKNDFNAL